MYTKLVKKGTEPSVILYENISPLAQLDIY